MRLSRRSALAAAAALPLVACGPANETSETSDTDDMEDTVDRIAYGDDPEQAAELYRPEGASRGVVVVIHGGFWRARYDHTLGQPVARSLAEEGWTAWNIEYRRV